jgi:hypothetical protein
MGMKGGSKGECGWEQGDETALESRSNAKKIRTSGPADSSQFNNKDSEQHTPCAGLLTSRVPPVAPILFEMAVSNRLRIPKENIQEFPQFLGCPQWTMPLLFTEYQVEKR